MKTPIMLMNAALGLAMAMPGAAQEAPAACHATPGLRQGWFASHFKVSLDGSLSVANPSLEKVTNNTLGGGLGASLSYRLSEDGKTYTRLGLRYLSMPGKHHRSVSPTGVYLRDRGPDGSFIRLKSGSTTVYELITTDPSAIQGAKSSLTDTQLTVDVVFPLAWPGWSAFVGGSANKYHVSNSGDETFYWKQDVSNTIGYPFNGVIKPLDTFEVRDDHGIKAGIRAGLQFEYRRHWNAMVTFQLTELGAGVLERTETLPNGKTNSKRTPFNYVNSGPVNPSWVEFGVSYTF